MENNSIEAEREVPNDSMIVTVYVIRTLNIEGIYLYFPKFASKKQLIFLIKLHTIKTSRNAFSIIQERVIIWQ